MWGCGIWAHTPQHWCPRCRVKKCPGTKGQQTTKHHGGAHGILGRQNSKKEITEESVILSQRGMACGGRRVGPRTVLQRKKKKTKKNLEHDERHTTGDKDGRNKGHL